MACDLQPDPFKSKEKRIETMNIENSKVSVSELRQLLCEVKVLKPEIGVRLRLIGELWQQSYFLICQIGERDLKLKNENSEQTVCITDLNMIIQFELSSAFRQFQPHFHYSVDYSSPDSVKSNISKELESENSKC